MPDAAEELHSALPSYLISYPPASAPRLGEAVPSRSFLGAMSGWSASPRPPASAKVAQNPAQ